jgi:UDP-GlcNAc:undecaprenyl-phosphate GlcNAc-1-phosphate transferase
MPVDMPALAVAFLLSVIMVEALRRLAPELGLIDRPNLRKTHSGLVPVSGGLAMFCVFAAMLAGWAVHSPSPMAEAWVLILALAMLVAVGMLDDLHELRPMTRLAIQGLAGLALCYWGVGGPGGPLLVSLGFFTATPDWIAFLVMIFFVVGCINAFNMADGLDGLAGGMAATALACIAITALALERVLVLQASLLLLAVVLGFLVFNMRNPWRRKASVFMGDAGSMMLGCAIGCFIAGLSSHASAPTNSASQPDLFPALLWLVAIPVIDTLSLMVRRPLSGSSPMAADRNHLHHLLMDCGLAPAAAVLLLVVLAALLGAIGLIGIFLHVPPVIMLMGLIAPAMLHSAFVRHCALRQARIAGQSFVVSPEAAE